MELEDMAKLLKRQPVMGISAPGRRIGAHGGHHSRAPADRR